MHISTPSCILRPWSVSDAPSLTIHANNPDIARNMRDGFPSPYTRDDADRFIAMAQNQQTAIMLAIEVEGEAVGGIGIHPFSDVYCRTAEIGYWLSQPYHGRGIVTDAVRGFIPAIFEHTDIIRIFAEPFAFNAASCRILEKAGFICEGTLRNNAVKNGQVIDMKMYSNIKDPADAK